MQFAQCRAYNRDLCAEQVFINYAARRLCVPAAFVPTTSLHIMMCGRSRRASPSWPALVWIRSLTGGGMLALAAARACIGDIEQRAYIGKRLDVITRTQASSGGGRIHVPAAARPLTRVLLGELGFAYDSNVLDDDRCPIERRPASRLLPYGFATTT